MHSYACFLRSKTTVFSVLNLYEMHLEFHHPQQHMQNKGFQTFVLHIFSNKYIFSRYRLLISFSQDKNIVSLQDISMVNHLVKCMKECELVVLSLFLNFSFKSFFFFFLLSGLHVIVYKDISLSFKKYWMFPLCSALMTLNTGV